MSVATADLNGDSRIDVVTANEGLNSVSVLLQAPAIGLSTGTLNFPINQAMGTTSPPQTLTVSSTGSFDLAIGAVSIIGTNSGDFSKVADTCSGVAIPSGSNCQVQLTFTPTASGARNATLRIPDNAPGNPHDVNLSGVGVGNGTVSLSPPSLDFGDQFVGTTSAQRQVMLTNTGTGPITVLGISLPNSSFLLGQNCSAPLPASASCTLFVSFSPFSLGPQAAAIRIDSDTLGSPNFVSLNGNGVPAPIVTLTPSSLTFGAQLVGTTSASQTITLSVTGNTLSISSINAIGEFNATHNCGTAVAAGTSCTISVTFQPSGTGTRLGTLIITDNGPGSPHTAALNGTGVTPPNVMLSATSLTFAAQVVSTTSSAQTITLTNMGSAPLTIASIGLTGLNSGDFAATHNCPLSPATLAVNANCTISVTFTPSASGARNASLSVSSDATGSPHSVALSGIGVVGPAASFSPASVTFGNQPVNTPSTPRSVTLTNSGSANLIISAIALTNGSVFSQTNNCPGTLAPAASCLFNLTFTPLGALTYVGSLSVTDNAPGSPHRVALTGNGADFSISVSPGTPTSATIQAGQSATFTLGLASTGFSGTVALACSHSIPLGTCVVSPSSVVLGGSGSPSATITVTTTAHALLPTGPGRPSPPIFYWREVLPWLVLLMSVPLLLTGKKERRRPALAFCVVMLCALFGAACAGGKASPLPGTPPGAYTITVNASSSGAVRSVALSVVVR
ncbi:MAG: choice-of-anchor D domain-containing protein [Deltaproteobacteria bacterium]|nr:choice-of-anchor D domain-containing protein [Deltaproteobacteria bacterium]